MFCLPGGEEEEGRLSKQAGAMSIFFFACVRTLVAFSGAESCFQARPLPSPTHHPL